MKRTEQLERAVLELPAAERAHLALAAWESLEGELAFWADARFDPQGVALAVERDHQIDSDLVQPLAQDEFRRLTGGEKK
jgi:hypothetical protein